MGYSKNPQTVERMVPLLTGVMRGEPQAWRPTDCTVDQFAYRIREALNIAGTRYAHRYPELAKAYRMFAIKVEDNIVRAVKIPGITAEAVELDVQAASEVKAAQPLRVVPKLQLTGPQTVEEVIGFWVDTQPSNEPISVIECFFTNAELDRIALWARNLQPAWEMQHTPGHNSFVIKPASTRRFDAGPSPITPARVGDSADKEETIG